MTMGILDKVKGCEMIDFIEIIETNYHRYLIDIGIEQYFQT